MCLIMYSPEGQLPPHQVWNDAQQDNPDGIGVMSERAIVKWTGARGYKKAWRHIKKLSAAGVPFAVHFRWRTHGAHSTAQCHPHMTELGSYLMHNGVLGPTASYATAEKSDTALYVEWYLHAVRDWPAVKPLVEGHINEGNKFVIMDENKEFHIFNEHVGVRHNGIWYSNDYSFDYEFAAELEAENEGYQVYTPKYGTNYGLGHSYPTRSAKESAETLLRKPSMYAGSDEWQEYYYEMYEQGAIDEAEMEAILGCSWEGSDLADRDDFDGYADRNVRDAIRRSAP